MRQKSGAFENSATKALVKLSTRKSALIAVSGGRDSVALLHFLVECGWKKLIVLHLHHGLRGRASDGDATFVRKLAERFGLRCEVKRVDIKKISHNKKLSLETAGRDERRAFFLAMAKKHRCRVLFTAHHADDQAETVLHRLCRGSSLAGASGMLSQAETIKGVVTLRPLLGATRVEINNYIARKKLKFREDASNASPAHTRNRVRHELLPLMKSVFQRDVSPLLLRFSEMARRDDECLQLIAREFSKRHALVQADGSMRLKAALKSLHPAILSRILFHWLRHDNKVRNVSARDIESAMLLLADSTAKKINLPSDAHLCRDARRLWVSRNSTTNR